MANKQVRLGLVFEGGVSLAVWMSGVAHEIDLLRRAGAPGRPEGPGFDDPDLRRWRKLCDELNVDVIVDVVAGTSAGGINGALLACAVAAGNPLPELRDLWVEEAQLRRGKLLREAGEGPVASVLDGEYFSDRLREVFDKALRTGGQPSSHPVTLLTTATALGEQTTKYTDCFGAKFGVADHRRVYRFRHDRQALRFEPPTGKIPADPFELFAARPLTDLTDDKSATLAHAARATASYPVAFEPVQEHAAHPNLGDFRFPRPSTDSSWLIDGGVLDNTPFEPLLREIAGRPVDGDWQRVIGFVTASDGLADSTVRGPGRQPGEVTRGWAPVLASALRMSSETSFRHGVRALTQQSLNAQRLVAGPEALIVRALADPAPLTAAARAMYEPYRKHRVDSGVLDACLTRIEAGGARPVCFPDLDPADPDQAPLWVPPGTLDDALANHQPWHWGSTVADRTVRLLIHHLLNHLRKQARPGTKATKAAVTGLETALGQLSRTLTGITAVRRFLEDDIPGDTPLVTPALLDAVNAATARSRSPEVLGALMRHAADTYTAAMPGSMVAADVLSAALVVDVLANASSGRQPFTREAQFGVIRMGPDINSPVIGPAGPTSRALGERKLYGTRLGHFGAFGNPDWRRHDYLWGRLDGAAHLVRLLLVPGTDPRAETERAHLAILATERVPKKTLEAGLTKVSRPTRGNSLDEIRDTRTGRRAVEDTVTDILRVLRHREKGIPVLLSQAGTWLSTVLASRSPAEKPPADLLKLLFRRGATPIRFLFWRSVRGRQMFKHRGVRNDPRPSSAGSQAARPAPATQPASSASCTSSMK